MASFNKSTSGVDFPYYLSLQSWTLYLTTFPSYFSLYLPILSMLNDLQNYRAFFYFLQLITLTYGVVALLGVAKGTWCKELGRQTGRRPSAIKQDPPAQVGVCCIKSLLSHFANFFLFSNPNHTKWLKSRGDFIQQMSGKRCGKSFIKSFLKTTFMSYLISTH